MGRAKRATVIAWVYLVLVLAGCAEVPITGRRQLTIVPDSIVNSMSIQQYSQLISESKVSTDPKQAGTVKEVGARIVKAVNEYCQKYCDEDPFKGYEWEFNLIEDKTVNAFAMPGGKVAVYTGILPVAQDEAGLATVIGHEIAHVFARHGNERMSQGLLAQTGTLALDVALRNKPEQTRTLFMSAYGLGAQVGVLLPFSRKHETEADRLGLIFMAMAGYDPHAAVGFWQRMASLKGEKAAPPELLSTHPASETRIENIKKMIPEALGYGKSAATGTPPPAKE